MKIGIWVGCGEETKNEERIQMRKKAIDQTDGDRSDSLREIIGGAELMQSPLINNQNQASSSITILQLLIKCKTKIETIRICNQIKVFVGKIKIRVS